MTDDTIPLTPALRKALRDCAAFSIYYWKPKAMERLVALGFVARIPGALLGYRITPAGREALANG